MCSSNCNKEEHQRWQRLDVGDNTDLGQELKDFPADRLDELHEFIQSLIPTTRQTERDRKNILSYGGAFGSMSKKDYSAFVRHTKKSRAKLLTALPVYEAINAQYISLSF